jgi:hypothetical protein
VFRNIASRVIGSELISKHMDVQGHGPPPAPGPPDRNHRKSSSLSVVYCASIRTFLNFHDGATGDQASSNELIDIR